MPAYSLKLKKSKPNNTENTLSVETSALASDAKNRPRRSTSAPAKTEECSFSSIFSACPKCTNELKNDTQIELDRQNKNFLPHKPTEDTSQESCRCTLRGGFLWSTCEVCFTSLGVREVKKRRIFAAMEIMYQTGISIVKLLLGV